MKIADITFPDYNNIRCLMMPYIQGDPDSVPKQYRAGYEDILQNVYIDCGDIGYLTIDESLVYEGMPHRGYRAKYGRALHTEAGRYPYSPIYHWGSSGDGTAGANVMLDRNVQVLLANNINDSCSVWDVEHEDTSTDGDIGYLSEQYPYETATMMQAGEVHRIGILTPHESLPVKEDGARQFLRIVSSGVHGREPYFTENPLLNVRS